jgi:cytochrome c peroxidase
MRYSDAPLTLNVSGTTISGVLDDKNVITVHIEASDGHGISTPHEFHIVIRPNAAPAVVSPNMGRLVQAGVSINYDPTKGGSAFRDDDGDRLSYEVRLLSEARGLSVSGTYVTGALAGVGAVGFEVIARDDYGGKGTDTFSVAVAAPEPGAPALPTNPFVYADEELPLPYMLRQSSEDPKGPLWDMTPEDNRTSNAGAALGRVLFYDKRLSFTNTHSCSSCHRQGNGFAVPERFSTGVLGLPMKRNAMALANVRYNFTEAWFWDMRVSALEELALMPIVEPTELGNYLPLLEAKLAATNFYPQLFERAFGTPEVTSDRMARALAQFLQALISYRSEYDSSTLLMDHLPGDPSLVLSAEEMRGFELFGSSQCGQCHTGSFLGTMENLNNGLDPTITEQGAGGGTFRAPALTNIAVSAPYMHDGRFPTLRAVIDHYDHGVENSPTLSPPLIDRNVPGATPLRLNLSEADKAALEAFLRTLTDNEFLSDPRFADPFK